MVSVPFRGFFNLKETLFGLKAEGQIRVSVPFRGFFNLKAQIEALIESVGSFEVSVPFRGFFNLKAAKQLTGVIKT